MNPAGMYLRWEGGLQESQGMATQGKGASRNHREWQHRDDEVTLHPVFASAD